MLDMDVTQQLDCLRSQAEHTQDTGLSMCCSKQAGTRLPLTLKSYDRYQR